MLNFILAIIGLTCIVLALIFYRAYRLRRLVEQRMTIILSALSNGVLIDLVDRYLIALRKHGSNSVVTNALRRGNRDNRGFIQFCDEIDDSDRQIGL